MEYNFLSKNFQKKLYFRDFYCFTDFITVTKRAKNQLTQTINEFLVEVIFEMEIGEKGGAALLRPN